MTSPVSFPPTARWARHAHPLRHRGRWATGALGLLLLASLPAATPARAERGTYSCKVTVGGPAGFDLRDIGFDGALGGCQLLTTTTLSTVTAVAPADGCRVVGDTDGDPSDFEGPVSVGDELEAGARVWAMCDATAVDRANSITLADATVGPPPPSGWSTPVRVTSTFEPLVTVGGDGTVYLASYGAMHRSTDGGETWTDVTPLLPDAVPNVGADTSVSVAPDNTVWYATNWGMIGGTLVCRSGDRGDTWRCNNVALPGITDRMWILGLSATEAYLQTNQGFTLSPQWLYTDSGGDVFVPYATTTQAGVNGNMAMDSEGAIWQVMRDPGTLALRLFRVENKDTTGTIVGSDTRVPRAYNAPNLAIADDVLWTAGEPVSNGSRRLTANRSRDKGVTWERLDIPITSESVAFSAIAARPGGRIAVAWYGSDRPGLPEANGGNWSVHVAETDNGLSATPTWRTTVLDPLVHTGNICAGALCGERGSDPYGRFAGDFMSVFLDPEGAVHVGYQTDVVDHASTAVYMRQLPGTTTTSTTTTSTTQKGRGNGNGGGCKKKSC